MNNYALQQDDINALNQSIKEYYCKIELLNTSFQVLDTIEGNIINDNFNLTGESAVRRTYNCDIVVSKSSFLVGPDKYIWFDKYIRVYYGYKSQRQQKVFNYLLGTFSFVDMDYTYTANEKRLSLSCSDMMCEYNGTKGGVMTYNTQDEITFKALAGQKIQDVLEGLCNDAGLVGYSITGVDNEVIPYDLEWGSGSTYYDAWSKIAELYTFWEFFFDEYGTFIWRRIPTRQGENVILDSDVLAPLVISEQLTDSFQNVYNATEVWGKELDLVDDDRYALTCTGGTNSSGSSPTTANTFAITLDLYPTSTMDDIDNFTYIAIKVSGTQGKYIKINNLTAIPIINASGTSATPVVNTYVANQTYVFCYRRTLNGASDSPQTPNFYLMGQFQAHGYYEETNPNVYYSIPNVGRVIPKVINMDSLYADEYCVNQAQFETYKTTVKQDSLTLQTIIIPFLEPSQKIRYTLLNTGEQAEWVIKSISWSSGEAAMSMNLYRFIEDYEYYYERNN